MFLKKTNAIYLASTLCIIWVMSYSTLNYYSSYSTYYASINAQLKAAAHAIPYILPDNFHHKGMSKNDISETQDLELVKKLNDYIASTNLTYLYSLILHDNKILFTSSSAPEEDIILNGGHGYYFQEYDDADPRFYDLFVQSEPLFLDIKDQWGSFHSIVIPIKTEDGLIYLLGADFNTDVIDSQLITEFYQTLGFSAIFCICGFFLYLSISSRSRRWAKDLEKTIKSRTNDLANNEKRLRLAFQISKQSWFDLNLKTGEITASDEYLKMIGYPSTASNLSLNLQLWKDNLHPDDKNDVLQAFQECIISGEVKTMEYRRLVKDNNVLWLRSIGEVVERDEDGTPLRMVGIHTDITESKQLELRNNSHRNVLELLIKGTPLNIILESIVKIVEQQDESSLCSISLLDNDKKHLLSGAAPSLPEFYNQAIDGVKIGPGVGSCGTAAFTRKNVYVDDIQTHPYWAAYKELAAKADLASCWSMPIIGSDSSVLGTFAIYHKQAHSSNDNVNLLDFVIQLATIAIERYKTDKKLQLFSQVFSNAHDGIMITDPHGAISDVNPAFCNITGYSQDEIIGKNPRILNAQKQPSEFYSKMWQSIANEGYWTGEVWNKKKNGDIYIEQLTISAIKDNLGQTNQYVGIFSDITKSKKEMLRTDLLEKVLSASLGDITADALLNKTLDLLISNSLLEINNKGAILKIDESKTKLNLLYHINLDDQLQIKCASVALGHCHCGRAAQSSEIQITTCIDGNLNTLPDTDTPHGHYNIPIKKGDNIIYVIMLELHDNIDHDPETVKFLHALAEILGQTLVRIDAEHKLQQSHEHLEERITQRTAELASAVEQANQAAQVKSNFLAQISHELRTPMHGILSFASFGTKKTGSVSNEKIQYYFENIKTSGDRLLTLINNLLDLSKLEAGKMALNLQETSLVSLFEGCALEQKQYLIDHKLHLEIVKPANPLIGTFDANLIGQVMTNLLSNAIKFSPENSVITASLNIADSGELLFSLQDQGLGIPKGETKSVFNSFTQSSHTKQSSGGTGLGLSISKEIIDAHNGKIWAEDSPNDGAIFHFTLPHANKDDPRISQV